MCLQFNAAAVESLGHQVSAKKIRPLSGQPGSWPLPQSCQGDGQLNRVASLTVKTCWGVTERLIPGAGGVTTVYKLTKGNDE